MTLQHFRTAQNYTIAFYPLLKKNASIAFAETLTSRGESERIRDQIVQKQLLVPALESAQSHFSLHESVSVNTVDAIDFPYKVII